MGHHQSGDADKRTGLMSMAYDDFAAFMADVDKAFSTWDKVMIGEKTLS